MKAYLKEITISVISILIMGIAVWAYLKSMEKEKSLIETDIYTLIPPDMEGLLAINRPSVFSRMILSKKDLYQSFASKIPSEFLSFTNSGASFQSFLLSFHPDGILCYSSASKQEAGRFEKEILQNSFDSFQPVKRTKEGVEFTYYPVADKQFFGFYIYNGVWVGSFSRKLLEAAANQQFKNTPSLPEEVERVRASFDKNAPLNILFPTKEMNLYVERENLPAWRITDKWLSADMFLSDGNFCCYGFLPYQAQSTPSWYVAMGDTLSKRINNLFPSIHLSFQINKADDKVYLTGCTPMGEE
ncbi:hypothetical protein M2459_003736 [Parabacteroides sp. PF5-5]|uniref:hypothetical protein n=1 Tax=unclassified Parabacteroides TaxID=2649774 RepID=UPI0024771F73|nr:MULTISPECIES: hypothetical protein [unclassified Parabacteroides]MDH6307038.1 hypothetical protein [Parabacteroides sp. PH5-39]MDH6317953.1 hypothetical protein [Parabacteroides sp. PF5-13]MDH6321694.1 hypothetical protein [Parabacteroides sp. PH5-13]MDH6325445.1 hypothetical protein [Parabacteroides sp. PH5-8]MDH6329156.1 hypothetical protein [Parabacteroides sp. PH5-41]